MWRLRWVALSLAATELHAAGPRRTLLFPRLPTPANTTAAGCRDAQVECAGWASAGECASNPDFMLSSCADSCTRCNEGPGGVGQLRSQAEVLARRDSFCGDLDGDCKARGAAGECHSGTDAPLRCAASCRVCRFPEIAREAYACDASSSFLSRLSSSACEQKRKRCARPPDTPALVRPGGIGATMRRLLLDFPQYRPRAISWPGGPGGEAAPWVVTLQDFISDAEAQAFISGCDRHFFRSLAGDGDGRGGSKAARCVAPSPALRCPQPSPALPHAQPRLQPMLPRQDSNG